MAQGAYILHSVYKVDDKLKDRIEYTLGKKNMYEKTIVITTLILSRKPWYTLGLGQQKQTVQRRILFWK